MLVVKKASALPEERRKKRKEKKRMATSFYDLTAKLLTGETFNFSSLKGKVVLIENVASL